MNEKDINLLREWNPSICDKIESDVIAIAAERDGALDLLKWVNEQDVDSIVKEKIAEFFSEHE